MNSMMLINLLMRKNRVSLSEKGKICFRSLELNLDKILHCTVVLSLKSRGFVVGQTSSC